jgi:2,4-dienoyl-CoA reductase-like NADH-dependent reductase (Old Yellow Enzyme family)
VKGVRLGVRLSPFGTFNSMPNDDKAEETFFFIAKELDSRDIAYVHFNDEPISIGHLNQAIVDNRQDTEEVSAVSRRIPERFLREFKERFGGPVILCGALTPETAEVMLNEGLADLAAFGVPFIANPDLPERMRRGWELTPPKTDLFYGGGAEGYIDYPRYEEAGSP